MASRSAPWFDPELAERLRAQKVALQAAVLESAEHFIDALREHSKHSAERMAELLMLSQAGDAASLMLLGVMMIEMTEFGCRA